MPTFICTKCGVIENTAVSDYWVRKLENKLPECSLCSKGTWHGHFERKHWSCYGIKTLLNAQKEGKGDFVNAKEHLRNIGVIGNKTVTYTESVLPNDTMLRCDK